MHARLLLVGSLLFSTAALGEEPIARPEHPDPSAQRTHWANLNGRWEFRFDAKDEGRDASWFAPGGPAFDKTIAVPFGWESALSGVHDTTAVSKVGWYRRKFTVPASFPPGEHVWLRFGAVDWRADVWVNGQKAIAHEGGYSPFEADITDLVRRDTENLLVVRAFDPTDPNLPTGKQVGWYTPTSGIWQTVWLESRPQSYIRGVRFRTFPAEDGSGHWIVEAAATAAGLTKGTYAFTIQVDDPRVASEPGKQESRIEIRDDPAPGTEVQLPQCRLVVREPKLWSPESPQLYDCELILTRSDKSAATDRLSSYFGLRTIARGRYGNEPFEHVLLNGKPIYLRLALDQSFNPQGVYTAPSDEFLRKDIELAKATGLNGLRIHIKPDEPRRLYWADKLGLLIMEDMPNTWRQNERARAAWEATMRETLARDRNHPAIFAWVAFNETWGLGSPDDYKASPDTQDWVKRMVAVMRVLDPTRLVEDNSPCNYDHVSVTDLNSWHFYIDDAPAARAHLDEVVARSEPGSAFNHCPGELMNSAPLINSEYGAVSAGGGDRDISWGFRDLTTQIRKYPKIQGYVYTELTDIEWEHNGFANYDRTPKTFGYRAFVPGMTVADLQGPDFVGYDAPPAIVARPGESVRVPIFVSHYSEGTEPPTLRWWVVGVNDQGRRDERPMPDRPVVWNPYTVTPQAAPLEFAVNGPFVGAVGFELVDAQGKRLAANFVNVVVKPEAPAPRVERLDDHHVAVLFAPQDFSGSQWSDGMKTPPGKAEGRGAGEFVYKLVLPDSVREARPTHVLARLELAAKANREKVDWPAHTNAADYPQTDERHWPSSVQIAIGSDPSTLVDLPDDPADARGVLSHLRGSEHGSYGYFVELESDLGAATRAGVADAQPLTIRMQVPVGDRPAGGLAVFGADTGAFPLDPTLILSTELPLPADLGLAPSEPVAVDRFSERLRYLLFSGNAAPDVVAEWRYTTIEPPAGWEQPDFDDAAWSTGGAGFGTPGTPGLRVRTVWDTPGIWLRTRIEVPALNDRDQLILRVFHDEDATIWINGKRLLSAHGYVTGPEEHTLSVDQCALFVPGINMIAVECHNTGGGQGIDVGLLLQKAQ